VLAVGVLGVAVRAPRKTPTGVEEIYRLWVAVAVEHDGTKPEEDVQKVKLTVDGEKYTSTCATWSSRGRTSSTPTKKPKQIDGRAQQGAPLPGRRSRASTNDDKTFKVCFGRPERPPHRVRHEGGRRAPPADLRAQKP